MCPTMSGTAAESQAPIIASASSRLLAIGFSTNTAQPRAAAASTADRCPGSGVATTTAWRSLAPSRRESTLGYVLVPSSSATCGELGKPVSAVVSHVHRRLGIEPIDHRRMVGVPREVAQVDRDLRVFLLESVDVALHRLDVVAPDHEVQVGTSGSTSSLRRLAGGKRASYTRQDSCGSCSSQKVSSAEASGGHVRFVVHCALLRVWQLRVFQGLISQNVS